MAAAEGRIRNRGLRYSYLGVEDENPEARKLYERLGYSEVGREKDSWEQEDERGNVYKHEAQVAVMRKDLTTFVPMMSAKRAARIAKWHEDAIQGDRRAEEIELDYLGKRLVVPPTVFSPTPLSPLLGKAVLAEVRESDRVLDMGTGSGVNAILAASKSKDVVAVDVNPDAVECAAENAKRNGVESRIQFLHSDVFDKVTGRFDLVIFDPPFRWFKPRNMLERGTADENYEALTSFFEQIGDYLSPGGRILLSFGSSGDIKYLRHLIDKAAFRRQVLASHESKRTA